MSAREQSPFNDSGYEGSPSRESSVFSPRFTSTPQRSFNERKHREVSTVDSRHIKASPSDDDDDEDRSHSPRFSIHPEIDRNLKSFQRGAVCVALKKCFVEDTGVLVDFDMGTGKTFIAIAVIHSATNDRERSTPLKAMVVCPASAIDTWKTEFEKWLPKAVEHPLQVISFKAADYKKADRLSALRSWHTSQTHSALIVGYELYRLMVKEAIYAPYLQNPGPELLVLDETQRVKNPSSQTAKAVAGIVTNKRIALTGTPIDNTLRDYWNVVNSVKKGALGAQAEFNNDVLTIVEPGICSDASERQQKDADEYCSILHDGSKDYTVRAESQLKETIPKTEFVLFVDLTDQQSAINSQLLEKFEDKTLKRNVVAYNYTFIRLFAHPYVLYADLMKKLEDGKHEENNGKNIYAVLQEIFQNVPVSQNIALSYKTVLLKQIIASSNEIDDKILVFSQSKDTIAFLSEMLKTEFHWKAAQHFDIMTGDVPMDRRQEIIKRFNDKENRTIRLLLLTTQANGTAITLTGANRVVIFDVSWTQSRDNQAADRGYRYGQEKAVFVYRFVSKDTFEDVKCKRNVNKELVSNRVRDDRHPTPKFSAAEQKEWFVDGLGEGAKERLVKTEDRVMNALIEKHPRLFSATIILKSWLATKAGV